MCSIQQKILGFWKLHNLLMLNQSQAFKFLDNAGCTIKNICNTKFNMDFLLKIQTLRRVKLTKIQILTSSKNFQTINLSLYWK
jgi:hypothetical protein